MACAAKLAAKKIAGEITQGDARLSGARRSVLVVMNGNRPTEKVASGGVLTKNYPMGVPDATTPDTSLRGGPDSQT